MGMCERKAGNGRSTTMFASTLSRIVKMLRKRGVFASSCISEHCEVHKQTPWANAALRFPLYFLLFDVFRRNIYSLRVVHRKESESI